MSWEVILAWGLYIPLLLAIAYRQTTKFNPHTSLLDKTDWVLFGIYVVWFVGLGVLITSLIT